jgi:hypothetical protein
MAAPLGFKTFNTGDVLSAADTNNYLMQGVLVFADAAARTAAITSPQEGQTSYLKDTDVIQVYSGSAWVTKSGGSSPLTTKGDLYTFGTGDTRLAVGTNGHTLVADSSTATGLKWAAPAGGGGKVLQVVNVTYGTEFVLASTTFTDTGLSATITPTLATSKVLVLVNQNGVGNNGAGAATYHLSQLVRGATAILDIEKLGSYLSGGSSVSMLSSATSYLDSPATTSATTYKVQMKGSTAAADHRAQWNGGVSTMTLLEIGA